MDFKVWDPSQPDVSFQPAKVTFPAFEFYKTQARQIAEYIRSVEVTESNVKEVKKELAQARKITDELSRRRIAIKKEILAEFDEFETEVKDLSGVISEAEKELRGKVHQLEEMEREKKEEKIRELWEKRACQYQIYDLLPNAFNRWMLPQYLNKTVTMKSIEKEMIDWLENTEAEIETLRAMDDEYLVEYLGTLDMTQAIRAVNERNDIRDAIAESTYEENETATFIITGDKDIKLTELLLKNNNINYIKR